MPPSRQRFVATPGNLTRLIRDDYLDRKRQDGLMTDEVAALPQTLSFQATWDVSSPLYFWQLYSLVGRGLFQRLILIFYESILGDDEAPWFRDVFAEFGDAEYHTRGQLRFWLDAFAGGEIYRAGMAGLHIHHRMAVEIMTERGAQRWMHHMRIAVNRFRDEFDAIDPRIVACLDDFLAFAMDVYGAQFDFHVTPWIHSFHARL